MENPMEYMIPAEKDIQQEKQPKTWNRKSRGGNLIDAETRSNSPTIRSIEARKKENLQKKRGEMKSFELDILTTPGKPVKSVPRLKEALDAFFDEHSEDPYVTINELANYLGYSDADALSRACFDESVPKYTALIRRAYAKVEDLMTKRMLYIADVRGDVKGYQAALDRLDRKREKFDPDSLLAAEKPRVNVSIEMRNGETIKSVLDDRIASLLSAQKGNAVDVTPKQIESKNKDDAE